MTTKIAGGKKRKRNNSTKKKSLKKKSSVKVQPPKKRKTTRKRKNKNPKKITVIDTMFDKILGKNLDIEPVDAVDKLIDNPIDEKKPVVVVLIHADWCGHCQTLKPEWNQMKESLNDMENDKIIFETIESAELDNKLPLLSQKYMNGNQVSYSGFPTIGNIENNEFKQYGGQRNSAELLEWIRGLISKVQQSTI